MATAVATQILAPESLIAQKRVLVLNSSFEPIKIISWQRAMLLYLADKIDVVDFHEVAIRSVNRDFPLPSIIRIRQYSRSLSRKTVSFSRHHIFLRDEHRCQYCEKTFAAKELTLDHVLPITRGGERTWTNLVTSCVKCNQKKGSKTPEEARMPLLQKPEKVRHPLVPDLLYLKQKVPDSWKPFLQMLLAS